MTAQFSDRTFHATDNDYSLLCLTSITGGQAEGREALMEISEVSLIWLRSPRNVATGFRA